MKTVLALTTGVLAGTIIGSVMFATLAVRIEDETGIVTELFKKYGISKQES